MNSFAGASTLETRGLVRSFQSGEETLEVLRGVVRQREDGPEGLEHRAVARHQRTSRSIAREVRPEPSRAKATYRSKRVNAHVP